jgi:hypothetical protein
MDHFTVHQTCKHGGCEMAIMFFCHSLCLAHPASNPQRFLRKQSCQTRRAQCNLCLRLQLLLDLSPGLDALQYALTVLVELQLGDDNL